MARLLRTPGCLPLARKKNSAGQRLACVTAVPNGYSFSLWACIFARHQHRQLLYLTKLKLTHFRNYEFQALEFSSRLNLVVGLNGMGKTNLLDAVYYLCMGKSHFGGNDRNVKQQGADFFRLEGYFHKDGTEHKVVAKVIPGQLKQLELDDKPYEKLSDHVGHFPVVFKAPDDTAMALEGSEERRRFVDNTLSQLDARYLAALIEYNRLLQRRNATLKNMAEQHRWDPTLLQVYDDQMNAPAEYIHHCRLAFISDFEPVFNQQYAAISGGRERVYLKYKSQMFDASFASLMSESREKDRLLQRTTCGIHKDDIGFQLNGMPLKRFASQGQLKSFVLALKLAQYDLLKQHKMVRPILLLDDLFDKLDDERGKHLIGLLVEDDFGQVFVTDTSSEKTEAFARRFGGQYRKFVIEAGRVVA